MKKLNLFVMGILLSFSAFAGNADIVGQKIQTTLGDHTANFFFEAQEVDQDFVKSVESILAMTDKDITDINHIVGKDNDIEVSFNKSGNQRVTIDQYEEMVLKEALAIFKKYDSKKSSPKNVDPKNYNPNVSNSLITLMELSERSRTNNDTFALTRPKHFYDKIRDRLKLPALDQNLCVKVTRAEACPAMTKKSSHETGSHTLRLEKPTSK